MSWLQPTIGEVCEPTRQTNPVTSGRASFRYVDISGIDRDAKVVTRADSVPCAEAPSRARKQIQTGDVLVSTVRPNLNAVATVPPELDGEIASTGFTVLRARKEVADPRYLFYRTQQREFVDYLVSNATGASYPAVSDAIVKRAVLPLPTPSEQRRIVEILDQADALRKRAREADAKAARILPALFLKMFGDPATNPMGWPTTTVGELLASADYGTSTRASDDGRGAPLIRMGNVTVDGSLQLNNLKYVELPESEVEKFALADGDILFNRTNSLDLVGKTGLWRGEMEAVLASYFIRLRVDRKKATPLFLWAYMNTAHMKRVLRATARGAIGQANINTRELRAFPTYLPSPAAQKRFAKQVEGVHAAVPTLQLRSRLDALFDQLLQRAFSGQLTTKWRAAHSQKLLIEMQKQARLLNLPAPMTPSE